MKALTSQALLFAGAILLWLPMIGKAQTIVNSPLLDYYQSNYATIEDPIQVVTCKLTGDHRPSFLITDSSRGGYRHFSGGDWEFYYPIRGGKYRKTASGYSGDTPDYIGYIKEIKAYGIVSETVARHASENNTIWVDFLKHGNLERVTLLSGTGDIDEKFPEYYKSTKQISTQNYTVDALQKDYPNAKLHTGLAEDPLRDYISKDSFIFPHDRKKPVKVYAITTKFTDDARDCIFITNDSGKYLVDVGALQWQFYRPAEDNKYSRASEFLTNVDEDHGLSDIITAPLNGPAYIGYIDEIKGYGAIYIDKQNNNWLQIQYADDKLIRCKVVTGADRSEYSKYIASPKTFKIDTYDLSELKQRYKER